MTTKANARGPAPGRIPRVIRTTPAFGLAQSRECSRLPVRHGQRPSVLTHDPGRRDAALQSMCGRATPRRDSAAILTRAYTARTPFRRPTTAVPPPWFIRPAHVRALFRRLGDLRRTIDRATCSKQGCKYV